MSGEERRGDGEDDVDGGTRAGTPGVSDADLDPDGGAGDPPGDDGDRIDAPEEKEEMAVEEENWQFTLEDLAEREAKKEEENSDEGEGIAGVFGPSEEIEPGKIDRESIVFVLLGAIVAGLGLYLMVAP